MTHLHFIFMFFLYKFQEHQPATLVLCGEVDLEVIRVIMDIQKAAALIKF